MVVLKLVSKISCHPDGCTKCDKLKGWCSTGTSNITVAWFGLALFKKFCFFVHLLNSFS